MDKYQRLKNKFANREKVVGGQFVYMGSQLLLPQINREDLDFMLFDGEHGIFDAENMVNYYATCRRIGLPTIFRVTESNYHLISKNLDFGADGIMVPKVETMEQLETAIKAMKFPPIGIKGCGGPANLRPSETIADFNKNRYLLPQIESKKGIALLPEMLEKHGDVINAIIIGPMDLSIDLGHPFDVEQPDEIAAIQEVFDICKSYGKSCGIYCLDEHYAKKWTALGCNVIWLGYDFGYFLRGFNDMLDAVQKL